MAFHSYCYPTHTIPRFWHSPAQCTCQELSNPLLCAIFDVIPFQFQFQKNLFEFGFECVWRSFIRFKVCLKHRAYCKLSFWFYPFPKSLCIQGRMRASTERKRSFDGITQKLHCSLSIFMSFKFSTLWYCIAFAKFVFK